MSDSPMQLLSKAVRQHGLVRFFDYFEKLYPNCHLKDMIVEEVGPNREMVIDGHHVINFGSDSFLGLDQDRRVHDAITRGVERWGSHNGSSRAFSSVKVNEIAEAKIAEWLGADAALIYPSVTLANMGAVPGLAGKRDLLIIDEHAHNSIQEAARIAKANGARVESFSHCDPDNLREVFVQAGDYRVALVALDGVYSMSGALPPLAELNEVAMQHRAVLYVDDAHASGVLGKHGRGTVLDALGNYDNAIVVGSLSKAFSCAGGFIGCSEEFKRLLKMRSNTYIFGGPVPPPYLEAACVVCDLLCSEEYDTIMHRLHANINRLVDGAKRLGCTVLGEQTPIVSILIGEENATLNAGHFLFERGFYVQSVTFPAVPFREGVLRVQINANHQPAAIDQLLHALGELKSTIDTNAIHPRVA